MKRDDDRWDAHWIDPKIDQRTLDEVKREHIVKILKQSRENLAVAAAVLGLCRGSLYNYMEKYGIELKRRCKRCGGHHRPGRRGQHSD